MKIGIHAFGPEAHSEEGVRRALEIGAEGVCLGVMNLPGVREHGVPDGDAIAASAERYRCAGIAVPAGYAGRWSNEMMINAPGYEAERERLRLTLQRMAGAGIESVLFYTTPERPNDPEQEERAFAGFVAFCQWLGGVLDEVGIQIACHPWVSRAELLFGFRRLHQMCQQVPTPRMGITFCPGGHLAGDDMRQVLSQFQGRIHFAHLRDQIGTYRQFTEVFPGQGEAGIPELVRRLRDSGYSGLLCPEHLGASKPGQDLLADAVAYAKRLRDT